MAGIAHRRLAPLRHSFSVLRPAANLVAAAALAVAMFAAAPHSTAAAAAATSAQAPAAAAALPAASALPTTSVSAGAVSAAAVSAAAAALPVPPTAWPSTHLEIGLADSPGGAAALHTSGAYKFRYQYLCGGVNTGTGWTTWNSGAKFADYYVDESVAHGITPVFIYYQLLQSSPAGGAENVADLNNLKNKSTMKSYWADFRLLMQHLGAYSHTIVVDIEPDLWGYIQQASAADKGSSVPAAVASSGDSDMSGLANNADGFAQGFVRLRNKYAPNVLLGYELSMWGTMTDPISENIPLSQIDGLAARSTAFQKSLGAHFDLVFTDPADRDADFDKIINGDGGASWWDSADYQRFNQYVGDFVRGVGLRMVLWQIPLGNTKMRAMDDSWGHYQDNHVQWWLDDTTGHLAATVAAGVVALLFGGGAGGTTSAFDDQGDGVTNPAPIDGNTRASYNADDDGGYFRHQTNAYYAAGAMTLPSSGIAPTPASAARYHPVTPVRVLDTRVGTGLSGKLAAGVARTFQITGKNGIPAGATAITANATVVNSGAASSIYLGPAPIAKPATYTMSFNKGQIANRGVTVAVSKTGTLSVTYRASSGTTDLVLDVSGYFLPGTTGDTYHALTPARVLDTRKSIGLSGKLKANTPRTIAVWGHGGVPSSAKAVTGNVTVVNSSAAWAVYLGPAPIAKPSASTINFLKGQIAGNSLTVALSSTGTLSATYMSGSGNTTDLVFDVTGYYTADATGLRYVPLSPAPVLDTRIDAGLSGKFSANTPRTFTVRGRGSVPTNAAGIAGVVSVVGQTGPWALGVGPVPAAKPTTSALNFLKGDVCSNGLTVALSSTGTLSATYMAGSGSTTNVVLYVSGYFVK